LAHYVPGLCIVGATLTPFDGALSGTPIHGYYDADKEAERQAVMTSSATPLAA
jgi:hypothetical protein